MLQRLQSWWNQVLWQIGHSCQQCMYVGDLFLRVIELEISDFSRAWFFIQNLISDG
jgi:hypothetical protein